MNLKEPYQSRSIRCLELFEAKDWRIKIYSILHQEKTLNQELIDEAKETALSFLPQPAVTASHYGVAFINVHQGKSYDFVTLAYWAFESELIHQSYMRASSSSERLEPLIASELSSDVWDIRLLSFERDAWLHNVLRSPKPDVEAYLKEQLSETV